MTTPFEAAPVSESLPYPPPSLDETPAGQDLFQEINERRARVENAELLQQLRGL